MINIDERKSSTVITGSGLKPLQVAKVISEGRYQGHMVMRTASRRQFEVMNLTRARPDACWTGHMNLDVLPLAKGDFVKMTVSNEE